MALPTNTLTTYAAIGNREDLSDIIYNIAPLETPFMNAVAREKATAVLHEWQTQDLASPNTSNAVLEGDDATTDAVTATVRLSNVCQISDAVARVAGTQLAVEHAGRKNELAYQKMLKGRELKRDMESILVGTNQAKNTGNASTARLTASYLSWVKTNTSKGASGSDPSAADGTGTRTDGTQRVLTETMLKTVLQSAYTNGGEPSVISAGPFNRQVLSSFVGRSTPLEDAKSKKVTATVSVYESDFGTLKMIANRFQRARDVLVYDPEMWAVAFLNGRNMVSYDLAKTGDSERAQLLSEYTLVARNEKASGIIADLTTS